MEEERPTAKAKDLFQDLVFNGGDLDMIPMAMGAPGPEALAGCKEVLLEATKHALSDPSEEQYIFQYGPLCGDPSFKYELAKFLSQEYGDPVDSENLMVTAGATQGLHLVASVLMNSETPIFVEDPTYFIAIRVLKVDLGYKVIPVPTDEYGIDINALEKLIVEHRCTSNSKSPFTSMLYCMTVLSNPTGKNLPSDRCKQLVALARKYDMLLFAEDVYNLLNYSDSKHSPSRLLSYDRNDDPSYKGNTISNSTFTKILCPGLRLGWIEATPNIIALLRNCNVAISSGSFNHYTSRLITSALKLGLLSNHLDKLKKIYGERMNRACEVINQQFSSSVKMTNPQGGFFLWLELPKNIDTLELLKYAKDNYHVNFVPGPSTSPSESFRNYIRITISFCTIDKIEEGIKKIGKALRHFL